VTRRGGFVALSGSAACLQTRKKWMSKIAFLGTGRMGLPMAQRVLGAGHELHVYNRNRVRAEPLAAQGAILHGSPRAACEGALAVFAMVADDTASREVWCGTEGVLAGSPAPGALALECSTLSHPWVMNLAGQVRARGLAYIDTPVTGLPDSVTRGELTLLVGADAADLAVARALLAPVSNRIIHFGPVGAGTAYKLLINLLGAVQIASAAEMMALAERAGLAPREVADALASGQAASPQVVRNTQRMAQADHEQNVAFTPPLRLKDIEYALEFARGLGLIAPFGEVARRMYQELVQRGDLACNESKIIDVARSLMDGG
jgi:3-hydroxyisobutyrate dehydrogenase